MAIDNLTNLRIAQQSQPQPQQITLPVAEVAGVAISLLNFLAVDLRQYLNQEIIAVRRLKLIMVGGVEFEFVGNDADQAYHWYLTFTGQAKVKPI